MFIIVILALLPFGVALFILVITNYHGMKLPVNVNLALCYIVSA